MTALCESPCESGSGAAAAGRTTPSKRLNFASRRKLGVHGLADGPGLLDGGGEIVGVAHARAQAKKVKAETLCSASTALPSRASTWERGSFHVGRASPRRRR
jgi:hypothetical protein